jgi:hypothetical protein
MMEDVNEAAVPVRGDLDEGKGSGLHSDGHGGPNDIISFLNNAGVNFVSFADWQILEQIENKRGEERGQPRVKITDVNEMLCLIRAAKEEPVLP